VCGGIQGHAGASGKKQKSCLQHFCSGASAGELIEGKSGQLHFDTFLIRVICTIQKREKENNPEGDEGDHTGDDEHKAKKQRKSKVHFL
jgi:hypothetical protein